MSAAIVGREDELAALAQFLSRDDWPRSLLLEGQPGAGKTTLWEHAVDTAREQFHVLAARPLETEAKLAHSGVGDLLAGVHTAFDKLPAPQAQALRAALLLETPDSGGVDQRGVALGFLGVLRALAAERPVLVAVDDLQWLDSASSRVVLSAARRLAGEQVALLLALRESERPSLGFTPERALPAFSRLAVEGLSLEDIHRLVQGRLRIVLSRPALRTVHATAGGNPLFALELARSLQKGHAAGASVQVPDSLHELVVARVTAVPAEARAAMLAAAALADPTLALVGAATRATSRQRSDLPSRRSSSRSAMDASVSHTRCSPRPRTPTLVRQSAATSTQRLRLTSARRSGRVTSRSPPTGRTRKCRPHSTKPRGSQAHAAPPTKRPSCSSELAC